KAWLLSAICGWSASHDRHVRGAAPVRDPDDLDAQTLAVEPGADWCVRFGGDPPAADATPSGVDGHRTSSVAAASIDVRHDRIARSNVVGCAGLVDVRRDLPGRRRPSAASRGPRQFPARYRDRDRTAGSDLGRTEIQRSRRYLLDLSEWIHRRRA